MADLQVTCITKPNTHSSHEHITQVGTVGGTRWTVAQVIASIDGRTNTFFVKDPFTGKRSDVGVVRPAGRNPHIRTHADGNWNDNLLSLPQC